VTFEYGKYYWIRFQISNNGPLFDSLQLRNKKTICTSLTETGGREYPLLTAVSQWRGGKLLGVDGF